MPTPIRPPELMNKSLPLSEAFLVIRIPVLAALEPNIALLVPACIKAEPAWA